MGNYTLGKLIGKGSFGKVYLASHKLSNGSRVGIILLRRRHGYARLTTCRSYSSRQRRTTPTSPARYTTIASSHMRTLRGCTRS